MPADRGSLGAAAPVHELRPCGCCDSSKNKHATAHFRDTKHPIIRTLQPGERWMWCYVDETMLD
jgi:ubiquitin-hydrolase Zn-finger-containing protein